MDCKETNKMISGFLNKELSSKELNRFMEHLSQCPECKEELTIQFLVSEGMVSLEDGSNFDLQKELDKHLEEARRKMRIRKGFQFFVYALEILVIITIITIIVLVMLL